MMYLKFRENGPEKTGGPPSKKLKPFPIQPDIYQSKALNVRIPII
jgi:hypothetical protein